MATQIKLRRDTAANWTNNNSVVLAAGEPGFETDSGKLKIGNGTSTWAQLSYISGSGGGSGGQILADQGVPTVGQTATKGFAFNEDSRDTGMFSSSNGHLELFSNARKIFEGTDNDVSLITSNADYTSTNTWHFRRDGTVELPDNYAQIVTPSAGEGSKDIDIFTNDWNGGGVEVYLMHNSGVSISADNGNYTWTFNKTGGMAFPSQPTNNRTGSAEALVFQKSNTQKSIATKGGYSEQHDVERLVIAGGDSYFDGTNWSGEGGDLYLWAGRGANGGDIKVDAGNSLVAGQEGGTIKIRGGHAEAGGVGGGILIQAGSSITENGEVNIQGQTLSIETRNAVRDNYNSWSFDSDGVLRGPNNELTIDGWIQAKYGQGAGIAGATTGRSSSTVVFSNADGTSRTVYTVNGNIFNLYGTDDPATYQVTVYIPGQGQYTPSSVTRDTETNVFTFTFGSAITLQGTSSYLVDWFYPDFNGVEIDAGNSYWYFDPSGFLFLPNGGEFGEKHWQTTIASVSFGTETIITLTASEFNAPTSGQVQIYSVPGGHPLNNTWYFQALSSNQIKLFSFEDWSAPIDSTSWNAWSGGGYVQLSNEVILKVNGNEWSFGHDGSTNFPEGKQVNFGTGSGSYIQAGSQTPFLTDGLNLVGGEAGVAVVAIDNTDPANAVGRAWQFKKTGDLELPPFVPGLSGGAQLDAVQTQNVTAGDPPSVVFTSTSGNVESIKALITVISTGAPTGNGPTVTIDTQICEMLITTRYQSYDGGSNVKTAVATVYGVTHTSDVPLATFTVNLIQNFGAGSPYGMRDVIQILAEPTAAVVTLMSVKTVATEILNYF